MFHRAYGQQIFRAPEDDIVGGGGESDLPDEYPDNGEDDEEVDHDDDDDLEGEEEDDDDLGDGEDDEPPASERQAKKPLSRAEQRIRNVARENRELKDRLARLEERPAHQPQPQQTQADLDAAERDLLAAMSVEEQLTYRMQKTERQTQNAIQALHFSNQDNTDKMSFTAAAARDPLFKAVAKQVEQELATMRSKGANTDRETIATYLIGKAAREKAGKALPGQQRRADNNRQRENGKPGGARSDVRTPAPKKGNSREALRERLKNVPI